MYEIVQIFVDLWRDLGPAYHQKDNFGTPIESVAKEFDLTLLDINTFLVYLCFS